MATRENLKDAFAGESQANRKYLAFAHKANSEGFAEVAKLFRAAAESETVHAMSHLAVLGMVKSTVENIEAAAQDEGFEYEQMYPKFVDEARKEDEKPAMRSFKNALSVEQVHHSLYMEALQAVKAGDDLPQRTLFVCSVCGNLAINDVPDNCPVCGAAKSKFREIK